MKIVIFLLLALLIPKNIFAQSGGGGCQVNSDCPAQGSCTGACVNNDNSHQLGSNEQDGGTCKYTCPGSSCTPTGWSGWSPCVGGCQYQSCQDGSGNGFQMQSCGGGICSDGSGGGGDPPGASDACTVNLTTPSTTMESSTNFTLTSTVSVTSGTVQWASFSSSNGSSVTVTTPDTTSPYTSSGVAVADGQSTITTNVIMTGNIVCSDTLPMTVSPPGPWWQVKDADISTGGNLVSPMASGFIFDEDGDGGFPGIPHYGGSSADFSYDGTNTGTVSSNGWVVNSASTLSKIYDYSFFERSVPSDTAIETISSNSIPGTTFSSGGTLSHGYYWYKYDGTSSGLDLTITSDADLGDRKVILLVDSANLILDGTINVDDGEGFFLVAVGKTDDLTKGNISVGTGVGGGITPHLEGIYLADNTFSTGAGSTRLYVRGSVAAYDGIQLERDLGDPANDTNPSEYFEYAPDQIMLYPSKLGVRKINWKEVAP